MCCCASLQRVQYLRKKFDLSLKILFCDPGGKPQPWLDTLRFHLPNALIEAWVPGAAVKADYAVVWAPPQTFFDEQPQLKGVFNIGAGVDALLKLRLPDGVPIIRLDDAGMSAQMSEFVCHAVIRHFREFDAYEADVANSKWSYRKPRSRADFPVGVMGLGVLGERVATALKQFDYSVLGWSRSAKIIEGVPSYFGDDGFAEFLSKTRVLVCLLPLTPQTENILCLDNLKRLLPGAYVINVARGGHLVDEDLIALIDSGHLAGAALDVFRQEPLPAAHPFWQHPKITVTPHTSARTLRAESIAQIAKKIQALESGAAIASIAGVVDMKKGY